MAEELENLSPAGVIPSFIWGDWSSVATGAAMCRGLLMNHRVVVPMPAANVKELRTYLETFTGVGFDAFAMPEAPSGTPVQHKAGFWEMSGVLRDNCWYHLAAGTGYEIPSDVKGTWTWSEEPL